jgi:hypothetical protein
MGRTGALFGRAARGRLLVHGWRVPQSSGRRRRHRQRRTFRGLDEAAGGATGVLAFSDGEATWPGARRAARAFAALADESVHSPRTGDEHMLSVTCFFVAHRVWRERGLGARLLKVAGGARAIAGATRVEGYPAPTPRDGSAFRRLAGGLPALFERCGIRSDGRDARKCGRPILRAPLARPPPGLDLARSRPVEDPRNPGRGCGRPSRSTR